MADDPSNTGVSAQILFDHSPTSEPDAAAEIAQLRGELEIVKNAV
jgi:hypothetical protein